MTPQEFIDKWKEELASAEAQWKYAMDRGWDEASKEMGARMQAISAMLSDYQKINP